jgi:hypothetical protein
MIPISATYRIMRSHWLLQLIIPVFLAIPIASVAQESELSGCWKTTEGPESDPNRCVPEISEYAPSDFFDEETWCFSEGNLEVYRYPCAHLRTLTYEINGDTLYILGNNQPFAHIALHSSALILTRPGCQYIRFQRQETAPKLLEMLKKETVSADCLLGNPKLQTTSNTSGEAETEQRPPRRMPESILIDDMAIASDLYKNGIQLKFGCRKRLFRVESIAWKSDENQLGYRLLLVPGSWWKKERFAVVYELKI